MAKPILLLLLLLLFHASPALSYDLYSTHHRPNFHPSKGVIIVGIISIALLLIAFLSLYLQRCRNHRPADALPRLLIRRRMVASKQGLNPSIIESFPTLTYSEVLHAQLKNPKSVECAVCISEFAGHETLRLLPVCGHAFHLDCIDMWLESHITCPVCRTQLDAVEPADAVAVEVGDAEVERSEVRVPGGLKRCSSSVAVGGGAAGGRWEWKVKSDRWAFMARKLPGEGEARNVKGEGTSRDGGIEA